MKTKLSLIVLTVFFASLMIYGGVNAVNNQSLPIPISIPLIPRKTSDTITYIGMTYNYDSDTNRYISANVTVQNTGLVARNCTIAIDFYESTTVIASGQDKIINILASQNRWVIVTLTWVSGKNLTNVTSGWLTIF